MLLQATSAQRGSVAAVWRSGVPPLLLSCLRVGEPHATSVKVYPLRVRACVRVSFFVCQSILRLILCAWSEGESVGALAASESVNAASEGREGERPDESDPLLRAQCAPCNDRL